MSDSLVFSEIDQFYSKKSNHKKTDAEKDSAVRTRILTILIAVLSCVLVVEAILYLVIIPCTSSVQIVFSGLTQYQPEDVIKSTNINVRQTWINFDTASIASKLAATQLFESVKVEKSFPDKVIITLNERQCAAVAIAEISGKSVPVQID
ncbi:MAG: FtsQ-type POTRA domain-containing protein [Spirochaetaceae bacterium]|nr:FtsQ-type POTRA domain-containing protein [Spirochaetaceae bacterium]